MSSAGRMTSGASTIGRRALADTTQSHLGSVLGAELDPLPPFVADTREVDGKSIAVIRVFALPGGGVFLARLPQRKRAGQ